MLNQIEPSFGREEADAIHDYILSGAWLTEHRKTRELESLIAVFLGVGHCFMVPNGTLALYAALRCLGVGPGDEVTVPAFTMIATANAVRMAGAEPIFVDIAADNLCLDLRLLEDRLTDRTKAVIAVDLNGRAPDLKEMNAVAFGHRLDLIEDAAQAFGSNWLGRHLGTFGRVGCFSFSPHKIISTGQGGCIVTNDDEIAAGLRRFKDFGREQGGGHDYGVFGVNLKFTDFQAVVGIEQMWKLPQRVRRKKEIFARYRDALSGMEDVRFIPTDLEETTPWYVDVLVERRNGLAGHLHEHGVGTQPFYPALHRMPVYASDWGRASFPVAEFVSERGLWLPSSVTLDDAEVDRVCSEIRSFYGGGAA